MTGGVHWPRSHGTPPTCEWQASDGTRIWVPARSTDFVSSTIEAQPRVGHGGRSVARYLAGVMRGPAGLFAISCLQLAADTAPV
jgi:hypothetical protein